MNWSIVAKKFWKHAVITGAAAVIPPVVAAVDTAGSLSGVDWVQLLDHSGATAFTAILGGLIGGGANAWKHKGSTT